MRRVARGKARAVFVCFATNSVVVTPSRADRAFDLAEMSIISSSVRVRPLRCAGFIRAALNATLAGRLNPR